MENESSFVEFSPDGRLVQVEYAQHASNQGSTIVIQAIEDKIDIAYEVKNINPLLITTSKIFRIDADRNFYMIFSGFKPDSNIVVKEAISIVHSYKHSTSENISIEMLARKISEFKQVFTVNSSYRPLGLRSILLGIEKGRARIFVIETDGNTAEYDRVALGFRNEVCNEYLEKHREEKSSFKALAEVIQSDFKKVKGFVLEKEGLTEYTQAEVESMMK